jgi:hypothetical protein
MMYLDTGKIGRPLSPEPPDVSVVNGILSYYRFLFFDTPGHYCIRNYRYWYKSCSLVRGCGHDFVSRGNLLDVPGCLCSKLIV